MSRSDPAREAWAGDPPQRQAARERLLEAAADCIARKGLAELGIAGVAAAAGVSRPTVYRYFEGRRDLVEATLLQAGRELCTRVAEHLRGVRGPAQQAVEAVLFVLREIPRDPVLRQVWSSVAIDAEAMQGFTRPPTLALCRQALSSLCRKAGWREGEADEACELLLRITLTLLAAPEPQRSPAELRAFLERRIVPALGL